jgi:uncharacterized protein YndB with AHSA1/START domain
VHDRIPPTAAEVTAMDPKGEQTALVYTTYIRETPERVWQGLTDPALMNATGGTRGLVRRRSIRTGRRAPYEMAHDGAGVVVSGPGQVILESDPPHRLAYTWHAITPEWAAAVGMDEATAAAWRAEARSKVAFDIEDAGPGVVKLTVTHDGFAPGSAVFPAISEGWPAVLATLKTLLETGVVLARPVNGRGRQQHRSRARNHSPPDAKPTWAAQCLPTLGRDATECAARGQLSVSRRAPSVRSGCRRA